MEEIIQGLKPHAMCYRGAEPDSGFIIHQSSNELDNRDLIWSLNQACCLAGKGRFYIFSKKSYDEASTSKDQVPKLVHVPYLWTKKDQEEWNSTPPSHQVYLATANYRIWLEESGEGQLFYSHPASEMTHYKLTSCHEVGEKPVWQTVEGSVKIYKNKLERVDGVKDVVPVVDEACKEELVKEGKDDEYVFVSSDYWN